MNQNYRQNKSKNAEMRNVVYKTLLRSLRRHLGEFFEEQNTPLPKFAEWSGCKKFTKRFKTFFENNFLSDLSKLGYEDASLKKYLMEL